MAMKVLLLDRNKEYAQRLAQFITKKKDMQISVCYDLDIARRMAANEHFGVILFDSEFEDADPEEFRRLNTAFAFISNERETIKDTETMSACRRERPAISTLWRMYLQANPHFHWRICGRC